jgi:hypothetical protein
VSKHLARGIIAAGFFSGLLSASDGMSAAQQNALIGKYCAVCHTDAIPNGGLSLQHFDASHPDPTVAAMLASKLKGGAMGAAGVPLPDWSIQDALLKALSEEAARSNKWFVDQTGDALTASIVHVLPSASDQGQPDLYRLTLTCKGGMQLAWSPGVPENGREMSAAIDNETPVPYKIEGREKMGNGSDGVSGPGAVVLRGPLPEKTLAVRNLFGNETVLFRFDDLPVAARQSLAACIDTSSSPR